VYRDGPDRSQACGDHRRATTTSVTVAPTICATTPRMAIGSVVRAVLSFAGTKTSDPGPASGRAPEDQQRAMAGTHFAIGGAHAHPPLVALIAQAAGRAQVVVQVRSGTHSTLPEEFTAPVTFTLG